MSPWLLCVCFGKAHAPFSGLTFVGFRIRKVYILTFWMCLRGSSVCALGRLMHPSPDSLFCLFPNSEIIYFDILDGSCVLPRIHFCVFSNWECVYFDILDVSPWLLCMCFRMARAPFPEFTLFVF